MMPPALLFHLQGDPKDSALPKGSRFDGRLAEGVMFPGGQCALCWWNQRSIEVWQTLEELKLKYVEDGKMSLHWDWQEIDAQPTAAV